MLRTSMADDQISTLVILLERRLESPYACLEVASALPVVIGIPTEVRGVKVRVAALYVEGAVASLAEHVEDRLGEDCLDERVEASGSDSDEDMGASAAGGGRG